MPLTLTTKLPVFFLLISGFFLPSSTAIVKICLGFSAIFLIWQSKITDWQRLAVQPLTQISVGFFMILAIGLSYSSAPLSDALHILRKYQQLLYLPLLLLLFKHDLARYWGEKVFFSGLSAVLIFSYLGTADIIVVNSENPAIPSKNHITQGILLALGVYLSLNYLRYQRWHRYLSIAMSLFIILAISNILFISEGRSGYMVLTALILLWVWQGHYQRSKLIMTLVSLLIVIGLVFSYQFSASFHQRVNETWQALVEPTASISSSDLRLEFLKNSWQLLQQQALWGTGTGSFAHEYRLAFADTWTVASHNPHNEYIHLSIQLGVLGLLILPYFLIFIWQQAGYLAAQQRDKIQALLMMLAVGCLFNSLLLDFTEMTVFVYLLAHNFSDFQPEIS